MRLALLRAWQFMALGGVALGVADVVLVGSWVSLAMTTPGLVVSTVLLMRRTARPPAVDPWAWHAQALADIPPGIRAEFTREVLP